MSTDEIHTAVLRLLDKRPAPRGSRALDVGSGEGRLIRQLRSRFGWETAACDFTADYMKVPDQPVDLVDLNVAKLPYPDASFDVVTCTEVIEHLENYRGLIREIFRVLRPGGRVVFSTPNILNLKSRWRYLYAGFWNLYGPLPVKNRNPADTDGHINPVTFFHLGHSLLELGFDDVDWTIDKQQRSSVGLGWGLGLFLKYGAAADFRRERDREGTIQSDNEALVRGMNSWEVWTGRTIVVGAWKPV